jgi:hypothetical protein
MTTFNVQQVGTIAAKGKVAISAPPPPRRYLAVANALAAGLRPLAAAGSTCGVPLAFLAAQVTETALKAFLLTISTPEALANSKDRHALDALLAPLTQPRLTDLTVYSIKGAAGISFTSAEVDSRRAWPRLAT